MNSWSSLVNLDTANLTPLSRLSIVFISSDLSDGFDKLLTIA